MRLAFQGTIDLGGQGTFLLELIRHLAPRVDTVHVFPTPLSAPAPQLRALCADLPANVLVRDSSRFLHTLARDPRHFKMFDVIHVNYATFGLSALLACHLYGVPYVYTIHSPPDLFFGGPLTRLLYLGELNVFLPLVSRRARPVTDSAYNQAIIRRKYDVLADVIHLGIDTTRFGAGRGTREALRRTLELGADDVLLLFVGRFHGYKDIPTLIRAMARLASHHRNIKLLLVGGGGDSYRRVVREIRAHGLAQHVLLRENVPPEDLRRYYAGADLFAFPSRGEGFGLVFLEAMASGLVIVAADAGASPEVIGDAGLLFEPGNSDDLAHKIALLLENSRLRMDLSQRGLARSRQFTWEKAAQRYHHLYQEVSRGACERA